MDYYNVKNAAMLLHVTPERLRGLIKSGQAQAAKRGRGYALGLSEIIRLAELEAARQTERENSIYARAGWMAEFTERVETFRWLRELAEGEERQQP